MQGAGCYYIPCKNTCVCEVNKLERRFYLVDAEVLPEVFLKVVKAKELLASGEVRSISAAPAAWIFRAVLFINIRTASLIPKMAARS